MRSFSFETDANSIWAQGCTIQKLNECNLRLFAVELQVAFKLENCIEGWLLWR